VKLELFHCLGKKAYGEIEVNIYTTAAGGVAEQSDRNT